jgi:O-antigen ligase
MSNYKTHSLLFLSVIILITGLVLGVTTIFGILPMTGIVLFLMAALITVLYKKVYHIVVLSGIWLLFCVLVEPSPSDILLCTALLLGFVTGHYRPKLYGPALFVVLLFFAYFITCIPGIFISADSNSALRYLAITLFLIVMALFICTYIQRHNIDSILRAYILAAFLSFLVGLIGYSGILSNWLMADAYRVKGLFKDPNVFGPFFVPAILLVISDINQRVLLKTPIVVHILLVVFLSIGVIFSFSRGAWINLVISLFFYFLLNGELAKLLKPKRLITVIIILLIFVSLLFSPPLMNTGISDFLLERAKLQDYDQNRFNSQRGGLQLALNNPMGVGSGQFENEIAEITKYRLSAHSLYIRTVSENGFAGFIFLFAALGYILMSMLRLYKLKQPGFAAVSYHLDYIAASFEKDNTIPSKLNFRVAFSPYLNPVKSIENPALAAIIAVIFGLLVSSLMIDTIHWRHFWFFIGVGMHFINRK